MKSPAMSRRRRRSSRTLGREAGAPPAGGRSSSGAAATSASIAGSAATGTVGVWGVALTGRSFDQRLRRTAFLQRGRGRFGRAGLRDARGDVAGAGAGAEDAEPATLVGV